MALYADSSKTFINPYNFISVEDVVKRNIDAEGQNDETLHTGRLHCTLTVKTPLVIPDTEYQGEDEEIAEHKIYNSCKINKQIFIPGSSIRGMLRAVFEAATNSCMSTIDPNEHITKRSDLGTFHPCVLKRNDRGEWELYKAERIALVGDGQAYRELDGGYSRFNIKQERGEKYLESGKDRIYFGQEVSIRKKSLGHKKLNRNGQRKEVWNNASVDTISTGGHTNCYLFIGEAFSNKHAESVFDISKHLNPENINSDKIDNALNGLEDTLAMYRSDSINRNLSSNRPREKHYGYRGYERAKEAGAIPLWYRQENGILYLSLAARGRMAFKSTMEDISKGHEPCTSRRKLCPACAVFGMIGAGDTITKEGKTANNGRKSLVRITDAICDDDRPPIKIITLKELGSPRTSYLQFYSEDGKKYDENGATIRGRKFYWHIPAAASDEKIYATTEKTKRNATFELIDIDSKFNFDVYYEDLTDDQLSMLMWSIQLPDNLPDNKKLMHKLGHGKPLGLGSVELKIDSKVERTIDVSYKLEKEEDIKIDCNKKPKILDGSSWNQFAEMLEFDSESQDNIEYPSIIITQDAQEKIDIQKREGYSLKDNVTAAHQWFRRNTDTLPKGKNGLKLFELDDVNIARPRGDFRRAERDKRNR